MKKQTIKYAQRRIATHGGNYVKCSIKNSRVLTNKFMVPLICKRVA